MYNDKRYFNVNKLRKDILLLFAIVVTPFLFFFYTIVPEVKIWETNIFIINAGVYNDVQYLVWFVSVKLLTLFILIIWFVTCTYKWKMVLIIPIFMEVFKLYSIIMSWVLEYDYKMSIWETTILITIFLFLFLIQYFHRKFSQFSNERMNNQINHYLQNNTSVDFQHYKLINEEFEKIKKVKLNLDEKEYLIKLIELRDKLVF